MAEDALKCRFVEALCLMETDELPRAAELFQDVSTDAGRLGNEKLQATAPLAKLHWGLAALLREKGHFAESVEAYREAQAEHAALGMRADVAALSLVIADLQLDLGESAEALRQISAALPVIDELGMARERVAALSLLAESARRKDVDRAALRELNLYLRKPQN